MAIARTVIDPKTAVRTDYHRIGGAVSIDVDAKTTAITLQSFVSKDHREAMGPGGAVSEQVIILQGVPPDGDPLQRGDEPRVRPWAYAKLQAQLVDWADAQVA